MTSCIVTIWSYDRPPQGDSWYNSKILTASSLPPDNCLTAFQTLGNQSTFTAVCSIRVTQLHCVMFLMKTAIYLCLGFGKNTLQQTMGSLYDHGNCLTTTIKKCHKIGFIMLAARFMIAWLNPEHPFTDGILFWVHISSQPWTFLNDLEWDTSSPPAPPTHLLYR